MAPSGLKGLDKLRAYGKKEEQHQQQQQQQQQQHSHQQAVATPLIVSGAGMVSLALGRTVGA